MIMPQRVRRGAWLGRGRGPPPRPPDTFIGSQARALDVIRVTHNTRRFAQIEDLGLEELDKIRSRRTEAVRAMSTEVNQQLSTALRRSKIVFMASVCVWAGLVGINNVMDYRANFQFVQHVLAMDTTFPGKPLLWRS